MYKIKNLILLASTLLITLPAFSKSNPAFHRDLAPSKITMKFKERGKLKRIFSAQDFAINSEGKMYIVAKKGNLFVYDEIESLWKSVDQAKGHLIGTLKVGLKARINKKLVSLDPQKLDRINGYVTQIAVSPDNQLWVITRDHTIYRRQGKYWQKMPGLASDIDIGIDGSIWALGSDISSREQQVRSLKHIAVRDKQIKEISRWDGQDWQTIALETQAASKSIYGFSVSGDGTPWVIQPFYTGKQQTVTWRAMAWDGKQWQNKSPPDAQYTQTLSSDEKGTIWACIREFDKPELRNRAVHSLMFRDDKHWVLQHHSYSCGSHVYQQQMWFGPSQNIFEGQPYLQAGWVVNQMRSGVTGLDDEGALWVEDNNGIKRYGFKRLWHGGNNWSLGEPTSLLGDPSFLISQSINQRSFHVVNTAPKPKNHARKRSNRHQVASRDAQPEIILNGAFRKIHSLAVDGDDVPWVMGLLMGTPKTDIFRGPFKYSEGKWQRYPVNIPHLSQRIMSGRDGAISIGGTTQEGKAVVATWMGGNWRLTELPILGGSSAAFTDSRGKIWAQVRQSLYYQQGALIKHNGGVKTLLRVPLKKIRKPTQNPKKIKTKKQEKKNRQSDRKQTPLKEGVRHSLRGCWKWSNGMSIIVSKNGSANLGLGPAPWRSLSNNEFEIEWPGFHGDVILSDDGQSLNSIDSFGVKSTAKRSDGEANSFIGNWRWNNGSMVSIQADGTMLAGPLRGTWSGSGRKNKIVWPVLDRIKLSADGNKLEGKNQFGSFTASRKKNCTE